jgi:hypothetical protein
LGVAASLGLAVTQVGAQQVLTPLWTHSSGTEGWTPKIVSLGNGGSQAWTQLGPYNDVTRLYSSQGPQSGSPAWQRVDTQTTFNHAVASAELADVHCTLHDIVSDAGQGLRSLVLRKYHSTSNQPDWTYTLPFTSNGHDEFRVQVSRDGQRVVAAARNIWTNKVEVFAFNASSATPLLSLPVTVAGTLENAILSANGRKLLLASPNRMIVVDTISGTTDHSLILFDQVYSGHAINADGTVFAYGTFGAIKVYRKNATGGYDLRVTDTTAATKYCDHLTISDDGSTLVGAFNHSDTFLSVSVVALDLVQSLTTGTPVKFMEYTTTGTGTRQVLASGVDCSADGRVFALGTWGDQNGASPEVQVFSRTQSAPTKTFDLPGSVQDLDLSGDGQHLVVVSRAQHNNVFGGGGRVDMLEVGVGDLRIMGLPRGGATIDIAVRGGLGSSAALMVSTAAALTPTVFPRVGTLYLTPGTLLNTSLGPVQADGYAHGSYVIPAGLVGQTLYLQGLTSQPRRLSRDWQRFTVLP